MLHLHLHSCLHYVSILLFASTSVFFFLIPLIHLSPYLYVFLPQYLSHPSSYLLIVIHIFLRPIFISSLLPLLISYFTFLHIHSYKVTGLFLKDSVILSCFTHFFCLFSACLRVISIVHLHLCLVSRFPTNAPDLSANLFQHTHGSLLAHLILSSTRFTLNLRLALVLTHPSPSIEH